MSDFTKDLTLINAQLNIDERLFALRDEDRSKGVPTILVDGLNELLLMLSIKNPTNILEFGTATGCSGIAMLLKCPNAKLTTIELRENSFNIAKQNFEDFNVADRVTQHLGDALDVATTLKGQYDFIFLDCNKSKYRLLLPILKELLPKGGVLFADNVLFRGYISGEVKTPRRFRTIRNNMNKFLNLIVSDEDFITTILEVGDGISISYKKN